VTAATDPARLHLITPTSTRTQKANPPHMNHTPDEEAKIAKLTAILKEACASSTPAQPGPVHRKMADLGLADHVHRVRRGLEAVRSLAIPSSYHRGNDDLGCLDRNDLVDLLEIFTDRLGLALESCEGGRHG